MRATRQLAAGAVRVEGDIREAGGRPLELLAARSVADDLELDVGERARSLEQRVQLLGMPDVAGMHDDEAPVALHVHGMNLVRVHPAGDRDDLVGRDAPLLQAPRHRPADRDHAIGPAQVEVDDRPEPLQQRRAQLPPRALGVEILDRHDERRPETARDGVRGRPEERRIGLAEDGVGAAGGDSAQRGEHDVREVVGSARRQPAAGEGSGGHADDLDAVPHLPAGPRAARRPRDDRHVVCVRQALAQLGQELRRRLGAGPVVLVENEEASHD